MRITRLLLDPSEEILHDLFLIKKLVSEHPVKLQPRIQRSRRLFLVPVERIEGEIILFRTVRDNTRRDLPAYHRRRNPVFERTFRRSDRIPDQNRAREHALGQLSRTRKTPSAELVDKRRVLKPRLPEFRVVLPVFVKFHRRHPAVPKRFFSDRKPQHRLLALVVRIKPRRADRTPAVHAHRHIIFLRLIRDQPFHTVHIGTEAVHRHIRIVDESPQLTAQLAVRPVGDNHHIRLDIHRLVMIQTVNALHHALAHDETCGLVIFHKIRTLADRRPPDLIIRETAGSDHKRIHIQDDIILFPVDEPHRFDIAGLLRIHRVETSHIL